jgi:virginiamycin B lyase
MRHNNRFSHFTGRRMIAALAAVAILTALLAGCTLVLRPNPVSALIATPGDGQATVSWTAPALQPLAPPITGYRVTISTCGTLISSQTFNSTATTEVVTGLTNGVNYTLGVAAINAAGTGQGTDTGVTPTGPGTPGPVVAVYALLHVNGAAHVSWIAPTQTGTSPITGYRITTYTGGQCIAAQIFNTAASASVLITGLELGVAYTFGVQALNASGAGNAVMSRPVTSHITNYADPTIDDPMRIAAGPDGALWFTNFGQGVGGSIGRITTSGAVTNYADASINRPLGIVAGPDGAMWFVNQTDNGSIGRITTSGVITHYSDPSIQGPTDIAVGADGNLWFTNQNNNSIGRITTSGVVTHYTDPSVVQPEGIAAGPDGAIWFTNAGGNSIGRITTSGVITSYTDPSVAQPRGIAAGPDGAMWFTKNPADFVGGYSIGRITTSGVITFYAVPFSAPDGIAAGPDGAMWFATASDLIGRITTSGVITGYIGPSIEGIAAGPDGNIWFTNAAGNSIVRVTP